MDVFAVRIPAVAHVDVVTDDRVAAFGAAVPDVVGVQISLADICAPR
jgi:hypothetical protein